MGSYSSGGRTNRGGRSNRGSTVFHLFIDPHFIIIHKDYKFEDFSANVEKSPPISSYDVFLQSFYLDNASPGLILENQTLILFNNRVTTFSQSQKFISATTDSHYRPSKDSKKHKFIKINDRLALPLEHFRYLYAISLLSVK